MKKLFLSLAVAGLTASGFAQGTVTFGNSSQFTASGFTLKGVTTNNVSTPVGTYTAALYYGTAAGAGVNPDSLTFIGLYHSGGGDFAPGIFNGPTMATAVAGGQTAFLEVAAWTGNANTWDAAQVAGNWTGFTTIFANPTGNPTATPPGTPSPLSGWNGLLPLLQIPAPEPASLALLGLGAAGLLFFRRKK